MLGKLKTTARVTAQQLARRAVTFQKHRSDEDVALLAFLQASPDFIAASDPIGYVSLIRSCIDRLAFDVRTARELDDRSDLAGARFAALTVQLATSVPPIPFETAARVARVGDELAGSFQAEITPTVKRDVAAAHSTTSSFGRKGRLLTTTVRFMRPASCLELGTGFGVSALYILSVLEQVGDGQLVTVESSPSRAAIAATMLKREFGDRVTVQATRVADALLTRNEPVDFLFHDAAHSGVAYIEDFQTALPWLPSGATVLFDDIEWEDRYRPDVSAGTYDGWRRVCAHERVRAAVEVDGLGLLLLS